MTAQRFVVATVAAGVAVLILGFISSALFTGLISSYAVTPPEQVLRESPSVPSIVLGALALGALLTVVLGCWTGHTSASKAFKTSAVLGLFINLYFDLSLYGMTTLLDFNGILITVVIDGVQVALAGTVVGLVLGRGRQA